MVQNVPQAQEYISTKKILPQKSDDETDQPNDENETDFEKFLQPDDSNAATI